MPSDNWRRNYNTSILDITTGDTIASFTVKGLEAAQRAALDAALNEYGTLDNPLWEKHGENRRKLLATCGARIGFVALVEGRRRGDAAVHTRAAS